MQIIRAVSSDTECRAIPLHHLTQLRGEWVVLTKSALLESNSKIISWLRARGHRLVADFIDLPVDTEIAELVDFLLASSVCQERFFRRRFSQIPTMHLTHHVDLRVPLIAPPADQARFGYFGKLQNCLYGKEIADLVCMVDASAVFDTSWMSRLAESNAHYAIRASEEPGAFKPFLKGFTAAHCGVPIVVSSIDQEARHYLGSEYPFIIEDLSLGSVRAHIERFSGEYTTSTWKSALQAMRTVAAQSSRHHVERELRAVLNAIW